MNDLIKKTRRLKPHDIISILEDFRIARGNSHKAPIDDKSILISIKIPQSLLTEFKQKCAAQNLRYQTQIKQLMKDWLK